MYILGQGGKLTVNSTTVSSIDIQPIEYEKDGETKKAWCIVAHGKGDKTYLLAAYDYEDRAVYKLKDLIADMSENRKTYRF